MRHIRLTMTAGIRLAARPAPLRSRLGKAVLRQSGADMRTYSHGRGTRTVPPIDGGWSAQ